MSSAQVPEGYRQTEIGVIPEDWDVEELNNLCEAIVDCAHSTPIWTSSGVIVIRNQNIRDGKLNLSESSYTDESHYLDRTRRATPTANDLVITREAPMGEVCIIPSGLRCCLGQRMVLLRPNLEKCDSQYLLYELQSESIQKFIRVNGGTGSTVANLRIPLIAAMPLPISSLSEQQTIAQALSDVDALIASLDKLIAKQRHLKTAAMQQLLTGKMRLPSFDEKWQAVSMNKHASLKARIGWQALTTEEYLDSGSFVLVTGTDFLDGRVNWSTCHFVDEWRYSQDKNIQLRSGDVLLTKDGTIGKVGYVENLPSPATLNSGVFVLRPLGESFYPLFLYYVLSSQIFDEFLNKIFAGSTISHLYQKDFVTFEFLAPAKEEQRAIATILSDMDTAIAALETRRAKTQAIKQGMMQELLTGRTRLV
jgi:type I restriction enzyme, S subunit